MLIIHTADIHLGASPDPGEKWGKNRKEEIWKSFERLIQTVERLGADLLLIAGDLFHRPPLLRELREVDALFASLSKTRVVLMAGNHDFVGDNSFYKKFCWAENVHFFDSSKITSIKFPEMNVEIYGMSYRTKEIRERIYDEVTPEDNGYYHILLAHGGDEKHIPYTKEKLEKSSFDYIAFGHIHKPGMIIPGKAVMAGSLEPTDHTCLGVHGYVKVEVKEGENRISLTSFAGREYQKLFLEVTVEDTMASICRRLSEKVTELGEKNIYDVIIRGKCHDSLEIMEEKMKSIGNIRKVTDETEKYYDYGQLLKSYEGSLLQRYISSFEGCETTLEKKALAYGTRAILEALER